MEPDPRSFVRRYVFDTKGDKNLWDSVVRLSEEVGWLLYFDDVSVERLQRATGRHRASRESVSREEFIRRLCREAGARVAAIDPEPPRSYR